VSFLFDPQYGRSTLEPTNVLVYVWVGGEQACVDRGFPAYGIEDQGFYDETHNSQSRVKQNGQT